jgi:HSP20 family protein
MMVNVKNNIYSNCCQEVTFNNKENFMNLIRVRRPRYLSDVQEEMNRILESAFDNLSITQAESELEENEKAWCPAVELNEQNGNYQVKAELPGVNKDNIDVEVSEDTVIIKAETKKEEEVKKENIYRSEIRYGKFMRALQLPSNVDNTKVQAEFKDGILTITAPKTQEEKSKVKKISIQG